MILGGAKNRFNFMTLFQFFLIICLVESGGNPHAIGNSGEFGAAQIMPIMMRDFNRISNNNYPHEWAFCEEISFEVFETVLRHYEPEALNQLDFEVMAKFWNGGPKWREKNLENYWKKVLTLIKKHE